jgi:5-methyltetrahydrofolate--homocysteine methyltransferase
MDDDALTPVIEAVLDGELDAGRHHVAAALEAGIPAEVILKRGLIEAMGEVGRLFEAGEYYVPEMLVAARVMKGCLEILRPLLIESDVQPVGRVVIGTVAGDLHDIGKNLVAMMMEGAGFEVHDLGVDVSPEEFVEAAEAHRPDIVALSALLTTTMDQMSITLDALRRSEVLDEVKVMVGGAPVNQDFADQIGAEGYAPDASQATALAKRLVAETI